MKDSLSLANIDPPLYARKALGAINIFTKCPDREASMDVLFDSVQVSRK
jgi:hypothetical protein